MKYILKLRHAKDYAISISRLQTDFSFGFNSAFRLIKYFVNKSIIIEKVNQIIQINPRKINLQSVYAKKKDYRCREIDNIRRQINLNNMLEFLD